ncbi:ORC-CDC6 family AAA ATPase [Pararcticibacter amylolyticus]|uniref:Uncharacterized protein n=1 Tax=Pararcticibacter amylolyticus TaxID=2173175 RepID=A0A2U2PD15_9SPHI|nr:hypothetical protein [Pararcticibacter amylolyticus]PWG79286.1 hypothetical protein DDR33_17335 [Pararcticibacter amylolyticus]
MKQFKNPFEYEAANNLDDDDIISFYIEDYNYSRFLNSNRNIFLVGERGSGKTMTLLYNSFKVQHRKYVRAGGTVNYEYIGIHIPCNTPLFHKKEYLLFNDDFKASVLCEHYLALTIVYSICDSLKKIEEIENTIKEETVNDDLFDEFEYLIDTTDLNRKLTFIASVRLFVARELNISQKKLNSDNAESFYENAYSFSSIVIPFIKILKKVPIFSKSHFLLMIDDAHDLNRYQIRNINSWIAYRDHSDFSFKIATAKINRPELITTTGGSILEGHDFITIDMEKPFQNEKSDFFQMAKEIIERRLSQTGYDGDVASFFPVNKDFEKNLESCRLSVRERFIKSNPSATTKQINDHVYKYSRAEYFRMRGANANLPPYSGFECIVDVSTGVIRNLLDPCYWMYDAAVSHTDNGNVKCISSAIQNHIIVERSKKMWERLSIGLDREVEGCSKEQGKQIFNLFENLSVLFKKRLMEHKSEPRAITFSISQINKETKPIFDNLIQLINIAQRAQIIYTRVGTAKDFGKQETYFVPNRLLMPAKGLDPHGQYARVSLRVTDLWASAAFNKELPFSKNDIDEQEQGDLFGGR